MLCSKIHCQKFFKLKSFSYQICLQVRGCEKLGWFYEFGRPMLLLQPAHSLRVVKTRLCHDPDPP